MHSNLRRKQREQRHLRFFHLKDSPGDGLLTLERHHAKSQLWHQLCCVSMSSNTPFVWEIYTSDYHSHFVKCMSVVLSMVSSLGICGNMDVELARESLSFEEREVLLQGYQPPNYQFYRNNKLSPQMFQCLLEAWTQINTHCLQLILDWGMVNMRRIFSTQPDQNTVISDKSWLIGFLCWQHKDALWKMFANRAR